MESRDAASQAKVKVVLGREHRTGSQPLSQGGPCREGGGSALWGGEGSAAASPPAWPGTAVPVNCLLTGQKWPTNEEHLYNLDIFIMQLGPL